MVCAVLIGVLWRTQGSRFAAGEAHMKELDEAIHKIRNQIPSEFERQSTQKAIARLEHVLDEISRAMGEQHKEVMRELNRKVDRQ